MHRALIVGMSLVCLSIGGMTGRLVPLVEGGTTGSTGAATEPARLDPVSDSHFEFLTESAGDSLDPLDPNQYLHRQCLVLSQRTTHAITRWWEQFLLLGYNRIDFQFVD